MSAAEIHAAIEAHERGDERPIAEIREEHYNRIQGALDRLRTPEGMAYWLIARWLKRGEGSATNHALMAWQAPGELVENHYGWKEFHTLTFDKGQRADLYLSNKHCLPVAAWSQSQMNLPADYIETRWIGEEVPTICPDYAAMLAESWRGADPEGKTMTRVRALNKWVAAVEPEVVRARPGVSEGLIPITADIPF